MHTRTDTFFKISTNELRNRLRAAQIDACLTVSAEHRGLHRQLPYDKTYLGLGWRTPEISHCRCTHSIVVHVLNTYAVLHVHSWV